MGEEADVEFENVFSLYWDVSFSAFGESKTVELRPGGSETPVKFAERQAFCDALVNWLLIDSVAPMFDEMLRGFEAVCLAPDAEMGGIDAPGQGGGDSVATGQKVSAAICGTLSWQELELIICGNKDLDFVHLREGARYE